MDNTPKQRKRLHLKDFDYRGSSSVYFLTLCTADKETYFRHEEVAKIVLDELHYRSLMAKEIKLFCYCIMPDHLHLLLSLGAGYERSLQNWIAAFKRNVSRIANELHGVRPLWQKNFYEHVVRKEESLTEIAEYILNNPVRRGIVREWSK
jgi:REP element-mobilizing transposase RayT